MKAYQIPTVLLFTLLALVACAGGGSGGTGYDGGGVGGSGIVSRGSIEELGSIVVNGTEFETTNAVVVVNGVVVGTGDVVVQTYLSEGKVVTVHAAPTEEDEYALAERVEYRSDVEGPVSLVDASDPDYLVLTVMGQMVVVNYLTQLENIDLQNILSGMVVEVSGFYDDQGTVWATFLEDKGLYQENTLYEVKGFIKNLDPQQELFQLNGLNVSYALADTSGLPGGVPDNTMLVEAIGTVDDNFTTMTADIVDLEDDLETDNAEEVEIIGFVTDKTSADMFAVGSQVVVVEEGAEFVDGEQVDIAPGKKLEAEGTLVNGILRAWEIEFWEPDQFEIEGPVTHIESINLITGEAEFTVDDDQVVVTTDQTAWEDGGLADIDLGVNLEIKGRMQDDAMEADKVSFELEGI